MRKIINAIILLLLIVTPSLFLLLSVILKSFLCLGLFAIFIGIIVYFLTNVSHQLSAIARLRGYIYSRLLNNTPNRLSIYNQVKIFHPQMITIGDNCTLADGAVLAPQIAHNGTRFGGKIAIGNNVSIGPNDRIASLDSVVIEDDVLLAAFVHITDHAHEFQKVGIPIVKQSVFSKGPVTIKRGCWLAFGCHILSGVTIGEYSVVAANSVVTKDVPPYSVVAANPARVVSKYNFMTKTWEKE